MFNHSTALQLICLMQITQLMHTIFFWRSVQSTWTYRTPIVDTGHSYRESWPVHSWPIRCSTTARGGIWWWWYLHETTIITGMQPAMSMKTRAIHSDSLLCDWCCSCKLLSFWVGTIIMMTVVYLAHVFQKITWDYLIHEIIMYCVC